jgi:hypothetical protein
MNASMRNECTVTAFRSNLDRIDIRSIDNMNQYHNYTLVNGSRLLFPKWLQIGQA